MTRTRVLVLLVVAAAATAMSLGPLASHRTAAKLSRATTPVSDGLQPPASPSAAATDPELPLTVAQVLAVAPELTTSTTAPTTTTTTAPPPTTEAPTTTTTTAPPPPTTEAPVPTTEAPAPPPTTEAPTTTTEAPPVATAPHSAPGGGWEQLRQCESGGDYTAVQRGGPGRGAYQFDQPTWDGVVGRLGRSDLVGVSPGAADPADQDQAALQLYSERGAQPWPYCGRYL